MFFIKQKMPWHKAARQTYAAAGLGIFFTMSLVYYGAQLIPSGWVALIFGLSPVFTGLIAMPLLGERAFTPAKTIGMALSVLGLALIFIKDAHWQAGAALGIATSMLAAFIQSGFGVWVKKISAKNLPPIAIVTGSLMVVVPLLLLEMWVFSVPQPSEVPTRALYSLLYLGLFGSLIGFALYFYILKEMSATHVSLITIITPISALALGAYFNNEVLNITVWLGASLAVFGLIIYQYGPLMGQFLNRLFTRGSMAAKKERAL